MAVFKGFSSSDFLSPNTIARKTNQFIDRNTGTIGSGNDNAFTFTNPFGDNPDAVDILQLTNGHLDSILDPNFGQAFFSTNIARPLTGIQPLEIANMNSGPGFGNSGAGQGIGRLLPGQVARPVVIANNPVNFNPLIWTNPNSTNILFGPLLGQADLLSGGSLQFPPFSPFPTQQQTRFPFNPFGAGNPIGGSGSVNISGQFFGSGQSQSPNLMQVLMQSTPGGAFTQPFPVGNNFQFPMTRPFNTASTAGIQPFGSQVNLMSRMQNAIVIPMPVPVLIGPPAGTSGSPFGGSGGNPGYQNYY